jgi:hypothetical protein
MAVAAILSWFGIAEYFPRSVRHNVVLAVNGDKHVAAPITA